MTASAASSGGQLVLLGAVVLPDRVVEDGAVVLAGDQIVHAGSRKHPAVLPGIPRAGLPAGTVLLPGLVDLHCHGGAGAEFGADEQSSRRAASYHHGAGTTSVMASLVSAPPETMLAGMRTCAALAREGVLLGVHTEGPFLSTARRGAQDAAALQAVVDLQLVDRLLEAADGHWRVMTFAPELEGAASLVDRLVGARVVPAVGHTDADAATTARALSMSRTGPGRLALVTHLFNGMPVLHSRSPGPVAAALAAAARGEACVELIADGVHLSDETVSMVMDIAAPGCVALVSDAMAAAGMPAGRYTLGRLDVVVAGGTARLADGSSIAGGVATLLDVVRRCVRSAGIRLVEAVRAASTTPAAVLGIDATAGRLAPGRYADVLAVDSDLQLLSVWRRGVQTSRPSHLPEER